jgi:hypothetical protein
MRIFLMTGALLAIPVAAIASTTPTSAVFHDGSFSCAVTGKVAAADPIENSLKNRIAPVTSATPITVHALRIESQYPNHPKASRKTWTPEELAAFKKIEDVPVSITGYIARIKSEGAESTNCGATAPAEIDFHTFLIDQDEKAHLADADHGQVLSGVVEITPRWRQVNPAWTLAAINKLVRITGWALYDYEHPEQLPSGSGKRSTLWEIHPVTMIEYQTSAGTWVELGATAK